MIKKISTAFLVIAILFAGGLSFVDAQGNNSPVYLFVSSETKTIVKDEPFSVDLHVNTMGNKVKKISTRVVIEGKFNSPSGFTYNKHPNLSTLPLQSNINLVSYTENETPTKLYVDVVFDSFGPKYFNEGSSDIYLYQIKGRISQSSDVLAYIDPRYTTVEIDGEQNPLNISTTMGNPLKLTVDSTASEELKIVSEKITQVSEDVSEVKDQVNTQKEQLNVIQSLLEKISLFFQKIISRFQN